MKKTFLVVFATLIFAGNIFAGTVAGQIQTPSTGRGIANGTLTFTLTQAAVISGTAAIASNANCWTDTSGNVVGLPGDAAVAAPVLSSNLGSGSLGSGTYFVRYTWANATGESQPSSGRSLGLGSTGTLIVQAPVNVPAMATSMKVYIGTAPGTETLQGSVAITNGVLAGNYSQATALVAGAALPSSNTSTCQIRFNDELQPSYTGYSVAFTNVSGAGIAGFPQKWYLSGGSNGTVNLSQGTPLYSGVVQYPQAIVANPAANGQQSINGSLNLNGFGLTVGPVTYSALVSSANSDRQILLQSPDFERTSLIPPPGWAFLGSPIVTYETLSPAPNKRQSIKITSSAGGTGLIQTNQYSVLPGELYTVSGYAKSDGTGLAQIEITFFDKNSVFLGNASATTTSTSWTYISASKAVPATAIFANVAIANATSANSSVWFDLVRAQNASFINSAQIGGPNPWVDITAPPFLAACDGTTDDTAALNSAITFLGNNGGGTVFIPNKTCKIAGQITIPNDGANPPNMKGGAIRIMGTGSGGVIDNGGLSPTCTGGSILDMTATTSTGRIDSRGLGTLEIEHICFKNSAGDTSTFIFATLTTVRIHHNQFTHRAGTIGDAIVLGGTGLTTNGSANDMCQGYGSVISDNQFNYVKRAVLLRNECNSYNIRDNHIFFQSSNATGGLIELDPGSGSTQATGNYIVGNLCETTFSTKYCVNLVQNSIANFISGNTCWDPGLSVVACVNTQGTGNGSNRIQCGYANENGSPFMPNTVMDSDVEIGCGPVMGQTLITRTMTATSDAIGNSSDQVIYSYTIPANTVKRGKGFRVTVTFFHGTGTASVNWKLNLGGSISGGNCSGCTVIRSYSSDGRGVTGAQCCLERIAYEIVNDTGVQNSQHNHFWAALANGGAGVGALNYFAENVASSAIDFTQNQLLTFTFNVANTDHANGGTFLVEHIR